MNINISMSMENNVIYKDEMKETQFVEGVLTSIPDLNVENQPIKKKRNRVTRKGIRITPVPSNFYECFAKFSNRNTGYTIRQFEKDTNLTRSTIYNFRKDILKNGNIFLSPSLTGEFNKGSLVPSVPQVALLSFPEGNSDNLKIN
jgi:hypothetical protein